MLKIRRGLPALLIALSLALTACRQGVAPPATAAPATPVPEVDCSEGDANPIAKALAEKYAVPYEQVIGWACNGETLDDIALALQTAQLSQRPPEELLKMRKEAADWDQVWEELGLN